MVVDRRAGSTLADFLRAARARVDPPEGVDAGLRRRRVPGLRREELARLAGVSVDYYTRLEQGRNRTASVEVIEALARALELDEVERQHLHDLAAPPPAAWSRAARRQQVDVATLDLLETFDSVGRPAFVLGRRLDVLADNDIAARLITDFTAKPATERNIARFVFLDPDAAELYEDWESVASDVAALLRFDAGRHPDDALLTELVGDLTVRSPDFARIWAQHHVHRRTTGSKTYRHPLVGAVTISYQALTVNSDPDQTLYVYGVEPGSPSAAALELLRHAADEVDTAGPVGVGVAEVHHLQGEPAVDGAARLRAPVGSGVDALPPPTGV